MSEETNAEKIKRLEEQLKIKELEAKIAELDKKNTKEDSAEKPAEKTTKKPGFFKRHWGKILLTLGILGAISHCTSDEKQDTQGANHAPIPSAVNGDNTATTSDVQAPVFEGAAAYVGSTAITGSRGARMGVQFDVDGDGKADIQGEVSREFWRDVKGTTTPQTQEGWEKIGVYNIQRIGRD